MLNIFQMKNNFYPPNCYLDYTYRYVTLYNSEDDPQHYSCTIQLPIYTYNITGYISIDDCRFSEDNRDYGPAYF